MSKSENDHTKSRGRPKTTGTGTLLGVRLLPDMLLALDAYIAEQPAPRPSRPEAIRRVLAAHLQPAAKSRNTSSLSAIIAKSADARSRAAQVADDEMSNMDATAEVKTARREALTERPAMIAKARSKRKS